MSSNVSFTIAETTYDLVVDGMTFAEARAVEKTSGVSFQELMENPKVRANIDVLQALLWVSMKRVEPTLVYSDLDDVAIDAIEWSGDEDDSDEEAAPADPFTEAGDGEEDAASSSSDASAT